MGGAMDGIMIIHESTREYVYPVERNRLAVRLKILKCRATACSWTNIWE